MEKEAAPGRIAPAGCEITLLIPAASFVSTPFPAETATFCIYRLPRQYLTGARRSTRLRGDVEMRIFRAAFRHVLMDRSRKSSLKESIAGVDSSRISALCGPKDCTKQLLCQPFTLNFKKKIKGSTTFISKTYYDILYLYFCRDDFSIYHIYITYV